MLKLIKYEWMKRWKFFLGGLIIFIILNYNMVSSALEPESSKGLFSFLLSLLMFIMGIMFAFDHIRRTHVCLYGDESHFLFSTPLSGYSILGEKVLSVCIECILVSAIFACTSFINFKILLADNSNVRYFMSTLPENFEISMFKTYVIMFSNYIIFILMVYLAMALSKSLLSNIKHGKTLSFGFFIVISFVMGQISKPLLKMSNWEHMQADSVSSFFNSIIGVNIVTAAILFMLTGYLFDKRINL